jgi:hypothetical protein
MELGSFFILGACMLTAGIVYFVLEYRMYGERESAQSRVMRVQADAAAAKKQLSGYTAYAQFIAATKQAFTEKSRLSPIKVTREYVYVENILQPPAKQQTVGVVIVRYAVEFSFAFNFKSKDFDIVPTDSGLEVQVPKPIFSSPPKVNAQPHEIPVQGVITDEPGVVAAIQTKLQSLALQYGMMIASDEVVLALCTAKLTDAVRSFLATQPGVKQVPTITVNYK